MMTAIVLAAGSGTRIGGEVPKQFLSLHGEPLLASSLRVFEKSPYVEEIILVTSAPYVDYCRREIAEAYGFRKVRAVIEGGRERYDSVYRGLLACEGTDFVMIHDGARPFVTEEIVQRCAETVQEYGTAVAGMPSRDTVKIADEEGFVRETPPRKSVWTIQTPQAFSYALIRRANEVLRSRGGMEGVTDDAMIVERSGLAKVRLVRGTYDNIKITTPEDLRFLEPREETSISQRHKDCEYPLS